MRSSPSGSAKGNEGGHQLYLVMAMPDHSLFLHNRWGHAPLPARAHVDHGVEVGITGNHVNKAAGVARCGLIGIWFYGETPGAFFGWSILGAEVMSGILFL